MIFETKRFLKSVITDQEKEIADLKQEVRNAKDLRLILEKLYPLQAKFDCGSGKLGAVGAPHFSISDDIAQYVTDLLVSGGKVIKQEATKAIVISKEGEVKTGLTREKPDEGYTYKLVRE